MFGEARAATDGSSFTSLDRRLRGQRAPRRKSHRLERIGQSPPGAVGVMYERKKAAPEGGFNNLATTYSRRTLRPTTIGAVVFHGRVRDGNGWGHHAKVTRSRLGMNQAGRDDLHGEAGGWMGGEDDE